MKIKELQERYKLKTRQSIYDWCKALGITFNKNINGHAYATDDQIALLDQLAEHLKKPGATISSFVPVSSASIEQIDTSIDTPIDTKSDSVNRLLDTPVNPSQIDAVANLVKAIAQSIQPTDPLHYMVILERAITAHWILTTNEVKQLIGVEPRIKKGDRSFKRGCFIFVKSGKVGGQTGWRVMKEVASENSYKV